MIAEKNKSRGGYPLISLLLFVAVCGVLVRVLTPYARAVGNSVFPAPDVFPASVIPASEMLISSFIGGMITLLLGVVVGFFHHEQPYGVLLGGITGFVIGSLVGPLTLIPIGANFALMVSYFGGSVLLVIIGAALRMTSRVNIETAPTEPDEQPEVVQAEIVDDDD